MDDLIEKYRVLILKLLEQPLLPLDDNLAKILPKAGVVYRIIENGQTTQETLYVGRTRKLRSRICRRHLSGKSTLGRKMVSRGDHQDQKAVVEYLVSHCSVQYIPVDEKRERDMFEHFVISVLQPTYND